MATKTETEAPSPDDFPRLYLELMQNSMLIDGWLDSVDEVRRFRDLLSEWLSLRDGDGYVEVTNLRTGEQHIEPLPTPVDPAEYAPCLACMEALGTAGTCRAHGDPS